MIKTPFTGKIDLRKDEADDLGSCHREEMRNSLGSLLDDDCFATFHDAARRFAMFQKAN